MLSKAVQRSFTKIAPKNLYGLERHGIRNKNILFNLSVPQLYEIGVSGLPPADPDTRNSSMSNTGALCAYSGLRYGRSPKDKRVIFDKNSEKDVWWGSVNMKLSPEDNHHCK